MTPSTSGVDRGLLAERRRPPRAQRWRALLTGQREAPQPARIGLYEDVSAARDDIGVCCSGGGVRSAAFNLGALQVLQSPPHQVLQRAKYLTAVSGGSYIAAAFCMVGKTWSRALGEGKRPPPTDPSADDSDPRLVGGATPQFHPGSPEEQYLRNHLGYLAPDLTARMYLALRMLAGMMVNTLLIGLPVFVLGLLVGWLARAQYGALEVGHPCPCAYGAQIPGWVVAAVLALAGLALAFALFDVLGRTRREARRQFVATWEVRLFVLAGAAAVALMLVPWLASLSAATVSILSLFAAALGQVRGHVRDAQKAAGALKGRSFKPLRDALIAIVVTLAGPALLLSIAVFGTLVAIYSAPADVTSGFDVPALGHVTWAFAAWLGGSVVALAALWFGVDIMSVSLHPFYKRRLATAFALKRVWVKPDGELGAMPDPPEGAAEAREREYDRLVALSRTKVDDWPTLVVCAAANVSDPGATPPGRSVASFTFSPYAIGGPLTGAVATTVYERHFGRNRRRDVTLLAAVAMSGAALSPAMGKLTYRPLKFLLALANVRLGVWVPNPMHMHGRERLRFGATAMTPAKVLGGADEPTKRTNIIHRPRAHYLWKEVLGRNRLDDKFLYVTDGGHYENLGLVELLRRGCRTVYCFDAGGGTGAGALGDAIALARAELGVEIRMTPEVVNLHESEKTHVAKGMCARGRIRFPSGVEGTLFYVRSVLSEHAPWELRNYQATDPLFPHHSTFDQFFTDQKFEAYRLLGAEAARSALALAPLHGAAASHARGRRFRPRTPSAR